MIQIAIWIAPSQHGSVDNLCRYNLQHLACSLAVISRGYTMQSSEQGSLRHYGDDGGEGAESKPPASVSVGENNLPGTSASEAVDSSAAPVRPTDEEILLQQNQIRQVAVDSTASPIIFSINVDWCCKTAERKRSPFHTLLKKKASKLSKLVGRHVIGFCPPNVQHPIVGVLLHAWTTWSNNAGPCTFQSMQAHI